MPPTCSIEPSDRHRRSPIGWRLNGPVAVGLLAVGRWSSIGRLLASTQLRSSTVLGVLGTSGALIVLLIGNLPPVAGDAGRFRRADIADAGIVARVIP